MHVSVSQSVRVFCVSLWWHSSNIHLHVFGGGKWWVVLFWNLHSTVSTWINLRNFTNFQFVVFKCRHFSIWIMKYVYMLEFAKTYVCLFMNYYTLWLAVRPKSNGNLDIDSWQCLFCSCAVFGGGRKFWNEANLKSTPHHRYTNCIKMNWNHWSAFHSLNLWITRVISGQISYWFCFFCNVFDYF